MWPSFRQAVRLSLLSLVFVGMPAVGWTANECAVKYKTGTQTTTKTLSAGQTFTFSPAVSSVSWVRNMKKRPVDVLVTNLLPTGVNPKWVTLPTMHARDPVTGNYSGGVKLFKARCPAFPDTQKSPAPGGSVPIPYPKIGK